MAKSCPFVPHMSPTSLISLHKASNSHCQRQPPEQCCPLEISTMRKIFFTCTVQQGEKVAHEPTYKVKISLVFNLL